MSEQIKCPICGKVGIPNYHKENVVCSCCGTDLSIFKMLADSHVVNSSPKKKNLWWKLSTACLFIIIIFSVLSMCRINRLNYRLENKVTEMRTSIHSLEEQLKLVYRECDSLRYMHADNFGFIYIVKRNDSPCRISKKLYGTERRFREIQAIMTSPLHPGDTLILPIQRVKQ